MTGLEKSALLLVSLGPERAALVMRALGDDDIERLSLEMARLRQAHAASAQSVLEELADTIATTESIAEGGFGYTHDVLEQALGLDRTTEIMGRLTSVLEQRPFDFLRLTPPAQIVTFLRDESPQTTAMVIANLSASLAAQTLAGLPEDQQAEIARRIAQLGDTSPEVVRQVEAVMRQKTAMVVHHAAPDVGGVKSLASILNSTGRTTERTVLDEMSKVDEGLAAEVRRLLFTFEDVVKLDDRAIQLVLREADQKDLALALRGVSSEVKDRILANMSQRGAQMLVEEIEFQPPQRRRVVEDAQGRIVAIIRRLEEADAIVLTRGEDDAVV